MNNKGVIYTWVMIIVALFVVMLLYTMLDQALVHNIIGIGRSMGTNNTTLDHIVTSWNAMPFVFFVSLSLVGIIAAMLASGR